MMLVRLLSALLATTLASLSPPLLAASPTIRSVQVTGEAVRVRDLLASGSAADASDPDLDRVLVTGMLPGEQRLLTPAEIDLRLREAGIDGAAKGWFWPASVQVTRRSQTISAADLVAAGEAAVRQALDLSAGDEASITPVMPPRPLLAPVGALRLDAIARRPAMPGGLWTADIVGYVEDTPALMCTVRYRVAIFGAVLVTTRPVGRHDVIGASDVTVQRCEITGLRGEPMRTVAEAEGCRAARAISPGTVLTTEWLEPVPAVRRRDAVEVVARAGAVSASNRAVALADGRIGETIAVRCPDGGQLLVRVTGPGRAEVIP